MTFAFDIETIPDTTKASRMPEPEVAIGNLKDPEKIAEKVNAARDKQLEKMGLDAATARLLCFSCVNDDGAHAAITAENTDEEEARIVSAALDILATDDARIVTWNGKGFDIPFLFKRAALLSIPNPVAPLSQWTKRYDEGRHVDLMKVWDQYQGGVFTSLEFFAATVLGEHKLYADFSKFIAQMQTEAGREEIQSYCLQDSRLTWKAYKLLQGQLF